jgi:CBS domain-containing protein
MPPTVLRPSHGSFVTPAFERATVADAMHHGVMSVAPQAPLVAVARTMAMSQIHCVLVAGIAAAPEGGRERLVWRLVTDMDLVRIAGAIDGVRTAGDAARGDAVTIEPSAPLIEAAQLMDERGVAHLLVIAQREPVGVLSSVDIAGVLAWGHG